MKAFTLLTVLIAAIVFTGSAIAVPPGKTIVYAGGDQGEVIFSGDTHGAVPGALCSNCHPEPFDMRKGSFKMTREDHNNAVYCGICHDGVKAFSQSNESDCSKCHKKGN